jgi:hypothetical protein
VVKIKIHPAAIFLTTLAGFLVLPTASAKLSMLDKQPWLGYYAIFASKRFNFKVLPQGNIEISPMNDKKEPVGQPLSINIRAGIEETLPDGKVVMKEINADTLESQDAATENLEKTSIRGKVTGDAEFELNIEQLRGVIFIGGRVLNPGTLTKNPIRFVVNAQIPNAYPYRDNQANTETDNKKKKKADNNSEKAFQKKLEDDSLTLKWIDGKRVKQDYGKIVDVNSKELNGPGIASAEIDVSSYHGKRVIFTAAPNSAMKLQNPKAAPLHEGFTIIWTADTAKDPQSKTRLAIEVR